MKLMTNWSVEIQRTSQIIGLIDSVAGIFEKKALTGDKNEVTELDFLFSYRREYSFLNPRKLSLKLLNSYHYLIPIWNKSFEREL